MNRRAPTLAATVLALLAAVGCAAGREAAPRTAPPAAPPPAFDVVPLGVAGGLAEDDLSAYLVARRGERAWAALDAGTLRAGAARAAAAGAFAGLAPAEADAAAWVLREGVRAYLVTHAHFDHYAGLVLNSPDDAGPKLVLGLDTTIDALRDHVFNGVVWANFADEGVEPRLGRYRYVRLVPGAATAIDGTTLTVEAHPLAHAGATSTAFLVSAGDAAIAYLGDTGPDAVERSDALERLWGRLAPLVRAGRLRALFIEVSYANDRPDDLLFGHLTPRWLAVELRRLAAIVAPDAPATALAGLPVVVTHVKPVPGEAWEATRGRIRRELAAAGDLGVRFVLPEQGVRLAF